MPDISNSKERFMLAHISLCAWPAPKEKQHSRGVWWRKAPPVKETRKERRKEHGGKTDPAGPNSSDPL